MKHTEATINTKKMFADTLKSIMRKKSFSKITVTELVAQCGVNRKTFYYHFEDIYDLLKWMLENEAIEVLKHFNLMENSEEALRFIMDYIEKNDYFITCAYDAIGRDEMKRFFITDFEFLVSHIIKAAEKKAGVTIDDSYRSFLSIFYTEAIAGTLLDWIQSKDEKNRRQVADYLLKTIHNTLEGMMEIIKKGTPR